MINFDMNGFNMNGFSPCSCDVINLDEWSECFCCMLCGSATGEHGGKLCLACMNAMLEAYTIITHRRLCVAKRNLEKIKAFDRERYEV